MEDIEKWKEIRENIRDLSTPWNWSKNLHIPVKTDSLINFFKSDMRKIREIEAEKGNHGEGLLLKYAKTEALKEVLEIKKESYSHPSVVLFELAEMNGASLQFYHYQDPSDIFAFEFGWLLVNSNGVIMAQTKSIREPIVTWEVKEQELNNFIFYFVLCNETLRERLNS